MNNRLLENFPTVKMIIKKDWSTLSKDIILDKSKSNEITILLKDIDNKRNNLLFDSNIDIKYTFNFNNLNENILSLIMLIYWLKKYSPKTINLTLPYYPYSLKEQHTRNDNEIFINPLNSFINLLNNIGISTIKTFDLWNESVINYSDFFIENIEKQDIFEEDIAFLKGYKKDKVITLISLNINDYNYFNNILKDKENINVIFVWKKISEMNLNQKKNFLNDIKQETVWNAVYIFENTLYKWNKVSQIINYIWVNNELLNIKELNLFITHWVFSKWSYRKFNNLIENYDFLNITTTNTVNWYAKYINNVKIIDINDIDKDND